MSRLSGNNKDVMKMIFLVLTVFVFLETLVIVAAGKSEVVDEISSDGRGSVKWGGYGEEKLSTVVISGKLLCHASHHPHPLSGALVSVLCGANKKERKSWAKGSTNSYGEFLIDLPSHLHAIPNLEKICLVKVLRLPRGSPCRHAFTKRYKGIKLTSIGEGIRIYTTHNVNFTPKPLQEQKKGEGNRDHTVSM